MTDRLDLSQDARKLLRRHFGGRPLSMRRHRPESLPGRGVEQTRQAYRELLAAGLMEPVSTFAGGPESLYRLTEQADNLGERLQSVPLTENTLAILAQSLGEFMSTTMTIPVTIAPEAAAFVDRMSQRREFELMIERPKHVVPGLTAIEVALDEGTDDMPPGVVLWTHRDVTRTDDDPTQRSWLEWMAATFPPEVCQNFVLLPIYRTNGR
jgi:hypothetical protein